ncbi:hypothetical protein BZG36_01233 [Bifiguratus adelaidae]|uniref:Rubisco LSMT substrate-binding domain-containing protein n=1 Tax=Bifiguratus adelaidae TaxID=1938954 RepID=A0A261Y662_9FUNG|nr:hypothetical protein BZG36_01233 [Bifiguratus adelaidae]
MSIPPELLVTQVTAQRSETFGPIYRALFEGSEELGLDAEAVCQSIDKEALTLTLFYVHERAKGEASFYHPHINVIPPEFTTLLWVSETELDFIQGSPLYYIASTMREAVNDVYDAVVPRLLQVFGDKFAKASSATNRDFLWAYTILDSRAFKLRHPVDGQHGSDASEGALLTTVAPLIDLANHVLTDEEAQLESLGIDPTTGHLRIIVPKHATASKGQPLYLKYNELANWQLLLFYGFAIPNNTFDGVNLMLDIPDEQDNPQMEMRKMLLLNAGEEAGFGLEHTIRLQPDTPILTPELLGSLRLLLAEGDELDGVTVDTLDELFVQPLSKENETRVLITLRQLFENMLEQYPTTIEHDRQQLGKEESMFHRWCLLYMIGQKEILQGAIVTTKAMLERAQ